MRLKSLVMPVSVVVELHELLRKYPDLDTVLRAYLVAAPERALDVDWNLRRYHYAVLDFGETGHALRYEDDRQLLLTVIKDIHREVLLRDGAVKDRFFAIHVRTS